MQTRIDTTYSGKDMSSSAVSVYEYTIPENGTYRFQVRPVGAGDGDYVAHLTLNDGDAQTDDVVGSKTTVAYDSGELARWFPTISIDALTGDVINIFVLGQGGDTNVGGSIRIFSENYSISGDEMDLVDAPNATAITAIQSSILSDATPFDGAKIDDILVDTGTTIPADLTSIKGATFNTSTDSLEAVRNRGDGAWITGGSSTVTLSEIWSYTSRTLTMSAEEILTIQSGDNIAVLRGDTLSISITDLGSIASRSKIFFTVRKAKSTGDTVSEIQIEETDNLLYLAGIALVSPIVASDGTLTVDDEDDGDITILLKPRASKELGPGEYFYDVQFIGADDSVSTKRVGTFTVVQDVTRATT